MLLTTFLSALLLQSAPQKIVSKSFCPASLFSEPDTGCISWNRYEKAGPLVDSKRNTIYVGGSDSNLHLISLKTGKIIKQFKLPGSLQSKPAQFEDSLIFGTNQGYLLRWDLNKKATQWERKLDTEITTEVVISPPHLFVVTGAGTLHALDLYSGSTIWEHRDPISQMGISKKSNPLVFKDKVIFGTSSGKLQYLQKSDGKLLFKVSLSDTAKPFPEIVTDPIMISDHEIAASSFNRGISILEADSGTILWSIDMPNISRLATDNKYLFAGSTQMLSAIDLKTQQIAWTFSFKQGAPNRLIVRDQKIYFGSDQDALFVLDAQSGKPLQTLGTLGEGFAADFDFSEEGALFALSTKGYLYRYGQKKNPRGRWTDSQRFKSTHHRTMATQAHGTHLGIPRW